MENAAVDRLHARIQECPLYAAKDRLIRHLDETREQKRRLIGLIHSLGGQPTEERAQLPSQLSPPKYLSDALKASSNAAEQELKTMEADAVIENAEVVGYNTLIQMAQKMDDMGEAIPVLRQNLEEEESMSCWLRANTPASFAQLWPQIETPSPATRGTKEEVGTKVGMA